MNKVDKIYCMNSFLTLRTLEDQSYTFAENIKPKFFELNQNRKPIKNSEELTKHIREDLDETLKGKKFALALSGGIDSAILAKYMPENTKAYTFKCVVPNIEVTDESSQARKYADECKLQHEIVEIYWEDFEKYAPILMKNKGMPIHSIEVQIYKACLKAKEEGIEAFVFGETADIIYGGLSQLLAKDWTISEFIDRYSYVLPHKV